MISPRRGAVSTASASFLALALAGAGPAFGAGEAEVLRLRAERLASTGRCEEALPLLERVRVAGASDARAAHVTGQCQIRMARYPEAVASLEAARQADPDLTDVDLHLAIARFHQGDLVGAEEALETARQRSPGRAELDLYDGLLQLQRADAPEAVASLERARRLDSSGVEPIASYYAGLAWLRTRDRDRAREALERVQQEAPGSPWAEAAEGALASSLSTRGLRDRRDVRSETQAERPLGSLAVAERGDRWMSFSAGFEVDDNVALRGSGVTLPREISHEGDSRAVWTAEFGAELWRDEDWVLGVQAAYYGSAHEDLEQFNVQYPSITAWLDRRFDEATTLRLQYDYGYAWVDTDPYLYTHRFAPAIFHSWGRAGTTRLFAELSWDNYLFPNEDVTVGGPPGLNESKERNRDGFGSVAGIDHVFAVDRLDTEFRAGYRYHRFSARGEEYSYQGHELRMGSRTLLPWELTLDLQGSYTYQPYRNRSTFPDPGAPTAVLRRERRREDLWQFDAILERPLTDWLVGSIRYSYYDNQSNRDVFDYDREIIGAYLTVRFHR